MSRRASKGGSPLLITIIGLVLVVAFGIAVSSITKKKEPFAKLPHLPVIDASENGNSLRGNMYRVDGKIEERWVKTNYEGLHLSVEENGQSYPIFIKIPQSLERPNLEREKSYTMSVEIGPGGIPMATSIERL